MHKKTLTSEFKFAKMFTKFSNPKCVFKKNQNCANYFKGLCARSTLISLQKLCNLLPAVRGYKVLK